MGLPMRQRTSVALSVAFILLIVSLGIHLGCNREPPTPPVKPTNGSFKPTNVLIRSPLPPSENFTLEEDLVFTDPDNKVWKASKGTLTDGASIPQFLLSFTGTNTGSDVLRAAIVHDAYCGEANSAGPSFHIDTPDH